MNLTGNQHLGTVTLNDGSIFKLPTTGVSTLVVTGLTITSAVNGGKLDLGSQAMVVSHSASAIASIIGMLSEFRTAGNWANSGIGSSLATPTSYTGLAAAVNMLLPAPFSGSWRSNGAITNLDDVLIKYTYNGDSDLNGTITIDDFLQIDGGNLMHRTGYQNGDFNYDGTVNAADYQLINDAAAHLAGTLTTTPQVVPAPIPIPTPTPTPTPIVASSIVLTPAPVVASTPPAVLTARPVVRKQWLRR